MVSGVGRTEFVSAVGLTALAGYVDAMGFIVLGGFFVSFMSGNTTRASVAAADGSAWQALAGLGVIGLFVLGVIAGSLVVRLSVRQRRARLLSLVSVLLLGAATASTLGAPIQVTVAALALAMGAENNTFESSNGSSVSLTYMTGTLVRFGQQVAQALVGGPRWGWVRFVVHWLGLVVGAVLGALVHRGIGLAGLWFAALAAIALACASAWRGRVGRAVRTGSV